MKSVSKIGTRKLFRTVKWSTAKLIYTEQLRRLAMEQQACNLNVIFFIVFRQRCFGPQKQFRLKSSTSFTSTSFTSWRALTYVDICLGDVYASALHYLVPNVLWTVSFSTRWNMDGFSYHLFVRKIYEGVLERHAKGELYVITHWTFCNLVLQVAH